MPARVETRIYRLAGGCAFVAAAALIAPRFVKNPEGGFASVASAILVMLVLLAAAFIVSLYLLNVTLRHYRALSMGARIAGLGPSLALALALLAMVTCLQY